MAEASFHHGDGSRERMIRRLGADFLDGTENFITGARGQNV